MTDISVLIVDDHALMRRGLRRILEDEDMTVVGEADNGAQGVALTIELNPDIVLMDIEMPGMNGIEATREIKRTRPDTAVIVLTLHKKERFLFEAVEAGAIGYLQKSQAPQELIRAIEAANDGLSLLQPSATAKPPLLNLLTAREIEVLRFLSKGMSNKEIGAQLFISDKTVKNHLSNIFEKLNINDRTTAAVMAVKEGLVK